MADLAFFSGGSFPPAFTYMDYHYGVSVTGGDGTAVTYAATDLPAGLSIDSTTGAVTGTTTATANTTANVTFTATQSGTTISEKVAIAISDLKITWTAHPTCVGYAYSTAPTVTGGSGTYTFSLDSQSHLPDGLTFDTTTGTISGTPTAVDYKDITIDVNDGTVTTSAEDTISVVPALSLTGSPPAGTIGTAYSYQMSGVGGDGTAVTITTSGFPDGLSFNNATAKIEGTPTEAGSFDISIAATQTQVTDTFTATLVISDGITITGTPDSAEINQPYTFTPTVGHASTTGTLAFSRTAGALPDGLTLDSTTGTISGTPTTLGSSTLTLTVSDGTSSASTTIKISVVAWVALSGTPSTAVEGKVYSFTPTTTSGGVGTLTYSATGLADWMSIDATTGTITGTPTALNTTSVVMTATDGTTSTTQTYAITSSANLSVTGTMSKIAEYADVNYTPTITGVQNADALAFSLVSGALPAGLTIATNTGTISGESTVVGSFTATYSVTDGVNTTTWTVDITVTTHVVLSVTFPETAVGATFSYALVGSGGDTTAYQYTATGLPSGLTIAESTGLITGTPTTTGTYTVDWSLTDGVSTSAGSGDIVVAPAITISGTAPQAYVGATYSFTPTISNTADGATVAVTLATGTLPDGLVLNVNTGEISGTPTTDGTAQISLKASDNRTSDTESFTITVGKAITISGNPPTAEVDTAYTFTPTVDNAAGTLAATVDKLPDGLTIDATTGVVSGTPTTAGTTTSVITVTDGHTTATLSITFVVNTYIDITGTPEARFIGKAFSFTPTVTGGDSAHYVYSVSDLPDTDAFPVTLDTTTGMISGTPVSAGTYSVKYTVTDGIGSRTVTLDLSVASFAFSGTAYEGVIGKSYRFIPVLTGGSGTYSVTVSTGTLPDGLTIDAATGVISGTATATGDTAVTLSATDSLTTLTLSITLSFTDRVVYAIAHRPEHYDPSSVYTSWTETDSSETTNLGYITQSVTPGNNLVVPIRDSNGNPAGTDNISIALEGRFLTCALTAQAHEQQWPYTLSTQAYAWTFAKYTSLEMDGYYIARMHLSNGGYIYIRWTTYDDGTNTCTRTDGLYVTIILVNRAGDVVETSTPILIMDPYNIPDGTIVSAYTQPLSSWTFTVYGVGTSTGTITVRSTDATKVASTSMDLSTAGQVVGYDLGAHNPINGSYTVSKDVPKCIDRSGWAFFDFISTAGTTSNVSYVYYTAAASYKLNKTTLYEDKISGLATTVAQFTGDVTEFNNTTPNYNDYHGRYATTANQTDSYTFASRTSAVGMEPKAVMLTAYANSGDDDTSVTLSGAVVSSDGTVVKSTAQSATLDSDGSAHSFILQKDPVAGTAWADTTLNEHSYGVTRTE